MLLAAILLWTIYQFPILLASIRHELGNTIHPIDKERLPRISLIVPAKNEEAVIERCLDALLNMDYPRMKMEIIVVEGGSTDATKDICLKISKKHPNVIRVIHENTPRGKPTALNLGLLHTTGEIVGVFDADSVTKENVLQRVASYFRDPSVMAVQGRTCSLNKDGNILTKVAARERKAWVQALIKGREKLNLFIPLTGSCQFVRREVLTKMGGWPDSLAEDIELALKLVENDCKVRYADDIRFWQETPSTLTSLITQRVRWYRGYMEAALTYGRLLKKPSWRVLDGEVLLAGPFMMALCLLSYLTWVLSLLTSTQVMNPLLNPVAIATTLTVVTLLLVGVALAFMDKPVRLKNILWIPFIYFYWALQTAIAGWALLQIIFCRPKVWKKTDKCGTVTADFNLDAE